MTFSQGDLHAFASAIIIDLAEAGLEIEEQHKWAHVVFETLGLILPTELNVDDGRGEASIDDKY